MISSPILARRKINPYSLIMFNFISKKTLNYNIYALGNPGEWGYGIATAPNNVLPVGYIELPGHDDITSDNYGNYLHVESQSVMCWIPKFFYHCEGPIIHIADSLSFSNREIAKSNGYALHRAFIDGGVEHDGFFIDKYVCGSYNKIPCSKNDRYYAYNRSSGEGQTLDLYSSYALNVYSFHFQHFIKDRNTKCSGMSVFNWGALSMLMLTHAWASKSIENNAWYTEDPLKNHVKGVNIARIDIGTGSSKKETVKENVSKEKTEIEDIEKESIPLSEISMVRSDYDVVTDTNDPTLIFKEWSEIYNGTNIPPNFPSKISHNGQMSGVMGLRSPSYLCLYGCYQQDPSVVSSYNSNSSNILMFLNENNSMYSLEADAYNVTSAPRSGKNLYPCGGKYDDIYTKINMAVYLDSGSLTGFYGNDSNNVFSNDIEGDNWILTGAGIPTPEGLSSESNEIGQKYYTNSKINIKYETNNFLTIFTNNLTEGAYNIQTCRLSTNDNYYKAIRYPD